MDIRLIKKIVDLVAESQIHELEVEEGELRIVVRKQSQATAVTYSVHPGAAHAPLHPAPQPPAAVAAPSEMAPPAPAAAAVSEGKVIPSPMVGTFYRSSSPEAPAFVQVGSVIEEDTVVCILEAMKVMNEIKAGVRGKITEILVENGNPVEFGQPMFRIAP